MIGLHASSIPTPHPNHCLWVFHFKPFLNICYSLDVCLYLTYDQSLCWLTSHCMILSSSTHVAASAVFIENLNLDILNVSYVFTLTFRTTLKVQAVVSSALQKRGVINNLPKVSCQRVMWSFGSGFRARALDEFCLNLWSVRLLRLTAVVRAQGQRVWVG